MSTSTKAVKSIFIIILITLGSKVLGFIREILIAAKFGSGAETDTFFMALTAITLFSVIFTQTINTTLIPILSEIEKSYGKTKKIEYTNNLLNLVLIISGIIVIVSWFLAPNLTRIIAYGFEGQKFEQTVSLIRSGMAVVVFSSILGVFSGYLQSEKRFAETAISQLPFNFVYIIFLLVLGNNFGVKGLMIANVLAVASQIAIYMPSLKKCKYKYQFKLNIRDDYFKKNLSLAFPILISVVVSDFNKIIDRSLASMLVAGSISALSYSNRIQGLFIGVFSTAIVTVLYPLLSEKAGKESHSEFKSMLIYGINTITLISIPATVGIIVLADPIVKLTFERGAFDVMASSMTASALVFYSIGIIGVSVKSFLNRAFYALQDTKTPMLNAVIAIGINVILNIILVQFMAHRGLALATSISAIVSSLLLLYRLKRKIGPLGINSMFVTVLKVLVSSIVMGFATLHVYRYLSSVFIGSSIIDLTVLLVSIVVGTVIYLLLIYLMKVKELFWFINLFKKKLSRKKIGN